MTLWEAGDPAIEASAPSGDAEPESDETWSLPELGRAVQRALAMAAPREVWVRGEIRGFRPANRNGNRYFELVAPGATPDARPLAKFSATLLKRDAPRVNARLAAAAHATRLADGVEVRVRVRIDWWTPNGQLSLRVVDIDPAFTLGRLEAQRAEVLASLQREGLLRRNAGQPLSPLPLRIGLVTSGGSAAHADFVKEIEASGYRFRIALADARMQGTAAPEAIAAAIASFPAGSVDVVALVRGGGARTDLATFDGFAVAEAVAMCPVPVFCGIGHEIDRCVVDEVAHTPTKTPTACAAALVEHVARAEQQAERLWARTAQLGLRHLARADHSLAATSDRVGRSGRRAVQVAGTRTERLTAALRGAVLDAPERASHRLSRRTGRAEGAARQHLRVLEERLAHSTARLVTCAPARTRSQETRLAAAHDRLQALDPARILARGWSITRTVDGAVARDAALLEPGAGLVTTLQHGTVTSTVTPDPGSSREATDVS
jgi:exodeoxyribonuclease VII large subunit